MDRPLGVSVMMNRSLLTCVLPIWLGACATTATARTAYAETAGGIVYDDANGNGKRDSGEAGIGGVLVSNGEDVVKTTADGSYRLGVVRDSFVFVIKPPGWQVPIDRDQLPRGYYHHAPEGTPATLKLRYRGVAPTEPLPASIDFGMTRAPSESSRFEAILISDPQPQTAAELDYIRDDLVASLIGTSALFGLATGDIMYDDLTHFPRYNALIGQIGVPWYNVPGNHEMNFRVPDDLHSLETFKRVIGPPYRAFQVGSALFVILETVKYHGENAGRKKPEPRGNGIYSGQIPARQLRWLANLLAHVDPKTLIVVSTHIPLKTHLSQDPDLTTSNHGKLLKLLCRFEHTVSFAGHTHTTEHHYFGADEGCAPYEHHHHVLTTVSGAWWSGPFDDRGIPTSVQWDGTPNGYHLLHVDGAKYRTSYHPMAHPSSHQLRVVLDTEHHRHRTSGQRGFRLGQLLRGPISVDRVFSTDVVVNLFAGGPRSRVTLRVDKGKPRPLERVLRPDPFVEDLYLRTAETLKAWVKPEHCSHCWQGRLPADLGPGVHTLTVEAVDEYGGRHTAHHVLEVTGRGGSASP